MQVLRTDICMDVGQSLNPSIDIGQASGAEGLLCWMLAAALGIEIAAVKLHLEQASQSVTADVRPACIAPLLRLPPAGGGRLCAGHGLDHA